MDASADLPLVDLGVISRVPPGAERHPFPFQRTDNGSQDGNQREQNNEAQPLQVMGPGRILLPLDITKCPLEVFAFINQFAHYHRVTVILLNVVNLNIMVLENRIVEDLSRSAEQHLKRLAEKFLNPRLSIRLRVRVGKLAQEILAEATRSNVDLIVLTSYGGRSFWKRPLHPRIVEKVIRGAPCDVTLLHGRTRFNCEEDWDCADEIISALEYTGLLRVPMRKPT